MTFWNRITLIAFIFFPLSALNAFFGLRTRFKDWRGIKSKKNFEKRLKELKQELIQIETFRMNLSIFFLEILRRAMPPIALVFLTILAFMGAFAIYRIPVA